MSKSSRYLLYSLSFLEGASVMTAELLGAKMIAPFFGTSLYVWASVLGVTLGGLAAGYFAGGTLSQRKDTEKYLYFTLIGSAVFLVIMPLTAKEVMVHTGGLPLRASILFSSFIFLFPPLFFMGMVSPLLVKCLDAGSEQPGRTAGTVFAVSTLGGILSTFLMGFYLIPAFGLTRPAIVTGIILGIIPFIRLISAKQFLAFIFPGAVFFSFSNFSSSAGDPAHKIVYTSEGILGQLIVEDYPVYEGSERTTGYQRILFVNRSTQTVVTHQGNKEALFEYVDLIDSLTRNMGCNKKALVLGLGGGCVAGKLVQHGFRVEAVELDARMEEVAKKYFGMDTTVQVHVDDARHFVNREADRMEEKYDVIVLDAFIGETNPHHLFTTEFFSTIKSIASDNVRFFINGNGFWEGEAGRGMRAVCKTLLASGFDVELIPTSEPEAYRNLLFVARPAPGTREAGRLTSEKIRGSDLQTDPVLEDDKPQLDVLNAEANKRWREGCMDYFLNGYYSGQDKLLFR